MAYLTYQKALTGWLNGNEPDDWTWFDAARTMAANLVQQHAPDDDLDPVPQDYADSAAAAELVVGGWILENRGRYTSLSGEPGSLSYVGNDAILGLIQAVMPVKYLGGGEIIITRGGPDRLGSY